MSSNISREDISTREKLHALATVATYRPGMTIVIVLLSLVTTLLEGIGLGFLLPIIEYARSNGTVSADGDSGRLLELFLQGYELLGVPFTLEFIILGVAVVMSVRISVGFIVGWLSLRLQTNYVRDLQTVAFDRTLNARLEQFDRRGSDTFLNALVTRVYYAESVIGSLIGLFQTILLIIMYFIIALYIAPVLSIVMTILFIVLVLAVRWLPKSAYSIGNRVAEAHEQIQSTVQAGTQGIREVKLFGMTDKLFDEFRSSVNQYTESTVALGRNQIAMESSYQFIATMVVFALIYFAITYSALGIGSLGVFTFAAYRLAPQINSVNGIVYELNGSLPHFVQTREFIDDLKRNRESDRATEDLPESIERVAFDDVSFSYDSDRVLYDVSFFVERDEFVAFVGPSGAGKSTIAALLARLYDPNEGRILANGTSIDQFDVKEWWSRIAMVPQDPHIFNETLRYNITVGNRDATDGMVEHVSEAAQVTEFIEELPEGYDTVLGDDGVRLSGGQQQRVAIARALLEDADLLVLDEATSHLDGTLENRVHSAIESSGSDYAVIAIAHRLGTVADADRIYAIKNGRIVEAGNHRELLTNDGTYSELYSAQSSE